VAKLQTSHVESSQYNMQEKKLIEVVSLTMLMALSDL